MNRILNFVSPKIVLVFAILLLSACHDGETSRSALPSTAALEKIADNAVAQPIAVVPTGYNSNQVASIALGADAGLPGIADVYIGTLDVPYYYDTTNSTSSFWSPSLEVVETVTVPVMMTLPNVGTKPDAGWPVVMYQHGITRNRTDLIAFADGLAQAGFAVIAIDLPTHGLVDATNPFNAVNTPFTTDAEQTFSANATSGQNFINLRSLLTARDNLRQGAANLLTLRKSLANLPDIDDSKVGLIAHSLGGMVAIPYLAVEATPTPSSIVMSGATITDVLKNSESFGPIIAGQLAASGITTEADLNAFYDHAQVTIDAGEPANYAEDAAANHPIHLIEVIGDDTVPNSSTENLATIMGATTVSTTTPGIAAGNTGIVRFTEGNHSSPLDPTSSPAATVEIQRQLASFQASAISASGPVIVISNGCVIENGMCATAE